MTQPCLTRSGTLEHCSASYTKKLFPQNPLIGWSGHYGLLRHYIPLWGIFTGVTSKLVHWHPDVFPSGYSINIGWVTIHRCFIDMQEIILAHFAFTILMQYYIRWWIVSPSKKSLLTVTSIPARARWVSPPGGFMFWGAGLSSHLPSIHLVVWQAVHYHCGTFWKETVWGWNLS
jgi:hypothetical protein